MLFIKWGSPQTMFQQKSSNKACVVSKILIFIPQLFIGSARRVEGEEEREGKNHKKG